MNWLELLRSIGPSLISLLSNTATGLGSPTAPAPAPPVTPVGTVPHPSAAIKDLQALLNTALALNPRLTEDGWLGPKTEAAIEQAIAKLKTLLGIP